MGEPMRILLYGNSVVLGCIGASMERTGRFDVARMCAPLPGVTELEALAPDVILFDAENGHPDAAFSLLKIRPALLLMSIDPDGNVVQLWSGRQYRELSTTELTALIEASSQAAAAG